MISPMVEAHFCEFGSNTDRSFPKKVCTLTIPHCQRKDWKDIRVRHYCVRLLQSPKTELLRRVRKQRNQKHHRNQTFTVDDNSIQVHTRGFCYFTCGCNETCTEALEAFLFAKLRPHQDENLTTVDVKAYLCSFLYQLEAFQEVSICDLLATQSVVFEVDVLDLCRNASPMPKRFQGHPFLLQGSRTSKHQFYLLFLLQKLVKTEPYFTKVAEQTIDLDCDKDFDPKKTQVEMGIYPLLPWKPEGDPSEDRKWKGNHFALVRFRLKKCLASLITVEICSIPFCVLSGVVHTSTDPNSNRFFPRSTRHCNTKNVSQNCPFDGKTNQHQMHPP